MKSFFTSSCPFLARPLEHVQIDSTRLNCFEPHGCVQVARWPVPYVHGKIKKTSTGDQSSAEALCHQFTAPAATPALRDQAQIDHFPTRLVRDFVHQQN